MTTIKVLGTGCANCKTTLKLIEEVAAQKGVAVQLEKIEDMQAIMGYDVMSTPGVVIDDKVVHAGGVPGRDTRSLAGSQARLTCRKPPPQAIYAAAASAGKPDMTGAPHPVASTRSSVS